MVNLFVFNDGHYSDAADNQWGNGVTAPVEFRRRSTADTRFGGCIATGTSEGADVLFQGGDLVDSNTVDALTYLQSAITRSKDFAGDVAHVIGNHEYSLVETKSKFTWAQYFSEINEKQVTRDGYWPSVDEPMAYYFDKTYDGDDYRIIVLYHPYIIGSAAFANGSPNQLTWLQGALNTSKHVVVFAHGHLRKMTEYSYSCGLLDSTIANLQSALETYGNVQAVISGHYHTGRAVEFVNDIAHIGLGGSVLAWGASDNRYYKVIIKPAKYRGMSQDRAGIIVTGYSKGESMDLRPIVAPVAA